MHRLAQSLAIASLVGLSGCFIDALIGPTESVAGCEDFSDLDQCGDCCRDAGSKYTGGAIKFGSCECQYDE